MHVPAQGLLPGTCTALDCQDEGRATSQALCGGRWGYLQERYQPHCWKNTQFYRLQELVMHRLHIVNSLTVMEIPNTVWP